MKKIKEFIPHALSASRIIMSPFIVLCGILGNQFLLSLLIVTCVATDYLDGKLARMWNIENKFSFSLDSVGDKAFIIASTIGLILTNPLALIPIPLELAIAGVNTVSQLKGFKPKTNKYGRIKQALLYLTYFAYSLSFLSNIIKIISILLTTLTVGMQSISLGRYIKKFNEAKKIGITNESKKDIEIFDEKEKNKINTKEKDIEYLKHLKETITNNEIVINDIKVKQYKNLTRK